MPPEDDRIPTPITTPISAALLHGVVEVETTAEGVRPHRLPSWARAQVDDPQLTMVEAQPAGVRLAFRSVSTVIEVVARPTKRHYAGLPPRPDGVYDLVVDGVLTAQGSIAGGDVMSLELLTRIPEFTPGPPGSLRFERLEDREKVVELWLPHDETTELIEIRSDAPIVPLSETGRRWVHHGSSISHGSNSEHPTGTWPARAARSAGLDLLNLGLGGAALLDPCTARVIRDQPADLISLKIGINLVNADLMRRRALIPAVHGFLDTIRDGHPDTPLLVISPILCPIVEDTPGPTPPDMQALTSGRLRFVATGDPREVPEGRLNLTAVREALRAVVDQRAVDDPLLQYLDGRRLYGEQDAEAHPLPDNLHPDGATHALIASRFTELVLEGDGFFARDASAGVGPS